MGARRGEQKGHERLVIARGLAKHAKGIYHPCDDARRGVGGSGPSSGRIGSGGKKDFLPLAPRTARARAPPLVGDQHVRSGSGQIEMLPQAQFGIEPSRGGNDDGTTASAQELGAPREATPPHFSFEGKTTVAQVDDGRSAAEQSVQSREPGEGSRVKTETLENTARKVVRLEGLKEAGKNRRGMTASQALPVEIERGGSIEAREQRTKERRAEVGCADIREADDQLRVQKTWSKRNKSRPRVLWFGEDFLDALDLLPATKFLDEARRFCGVTSDVQERRKGQATLYRGRGQRGLNPLAQVRGNT